jgi:drug/metabolite transporter (DMT)-like permease
MPFASNLLGIIFALTSAVVWGGGDFSGGLASRRSTPYQVLFLSGPLGVLMLFIFAFVWRESMPSLGGITWAVLAGVVGTVGLASLYRALSLGHTAVVAPTSAVICAVLPVLFSIFTAGLPGFLRLAGFAIALAGIWLVAQPATGDGGRVSRQGFLLACLAGVSFGSFFILLGLVERGSVFFPLAAARSVELILAVGLLLVTRSHIPGWKENPIAVLAGLLDVGGNVFYMLARQLTSLDVAAVLASLYPASTVMLAGWVLKEKVSPRQWLGVGLCLAAIALITI